MTGSTVPAFPNVGPVRVLRTVGVWAVAAALSLLVAWKLRLGPRVAGLSHTHGVHLGDVVAVVVLGAVATWFTVWDRRRRAGTDR